jgi:excinuclease ABC subunit A
MICVTGVSGSGKSTLINETLPILNAYYFNGVKNRNHKKIEGLEHIDKVMILTKVRW